MAFMAGASFPQLQNIDVIGGSMTCESATSCVPNVKRISVSNGASVSSDAKSVAPITAPKAALYLETGSHFYVGAGVENTVKKLYLDGVQKEAGTYTGETAEKGIVLQPMRRYSGAETFYTGTLKVQKGPGMVLLFR